MWTNTHVKRHRAHHQDDSAGHLYQGRFRSFPVQEDRHLLTVLRYVEANPLRTGLAAKASDWPWSSHALRDADDPLRLLTEWPVRRPPRWSEMVERRWADADVQALRQSITRGRPFGEMEWTRRTADRLGLATSLKPMGRPKKGASHLFD